MKRYYMALFALLLAVAPSACGTHGGQLTASPSVIPSLSDNPIHPLDTHGGIASMSVDFTDAAPVIAGKHLAHFNVAIREIDVTDSQGHSQVVAQYSKPLIVDMLQYQGPVGASVGTASVTDKTYTSIRFVIDTASSQAIFTDDSNAPLTFTLGKHTASKANVGATTSTTEAGHGLVAITDQRQFTLGTNLSETVSVDFNLFESLAPLGTGGQSGDNKHFDLHGGIAVEPCFFVAGEDTAGQLTGQVVNQGGSPVAGATVVAIASDGTPGNSALTDASGYFSMHTLSSGLYTLRIYNAYTNAAGANYTSTGATSGSDVLTGPGVLVNSGLTTFAGTITD